MGTEPCIWFSKSTAISRWFRWSSVGLWMLLDLYRVGCPFW